MAQSLQVPKFGKWDDGEDVPYTTYFDNATKAKSERLNLNDPSHREEISERQETREGVVRRQTESPLHRDGSELPGQDYDSLKSTTSRGQQALRQKYTQEDLSLEDGNTKKRLQSPLDHRTRGHVSFNSPLHQHQGNNTATVRNGAASDGNIENPSLQTRQHPRTEAKSIVPSSPLRDRRGSSSPKGGCHDGVTPLTPGRSRQQSAPRGIETPDRSPTVPRFGDWDESDPTSSENYTSIFTRVREERQTEEEGGFPVGTNISHADHRNRSNAENSKKCCCFPWGK
ncbi:RPM1-interacting protein 4, partial [Cucurbita argyrosperma subsp. sororia]